MNVAELTQVGFPGFAGAGALNGPAFGGFTLPPALGGALDRLAASPLGNTPLTSAQQAQLLQLQQQNNAQELVVFLLSLVTGLLQAACANCGAQGGCNCSSGTTAASSVGPANASAPQVGSTAAATAPGGPATPGRNGFLNPLDGELNITSGFGPRNSPGGVGSSNHKGIDLSAPTGTPIRAAKAGRVSVSQNDGDGYGNWVEIRHEDGTSTRYAHMSQRQANTGDMVQQGQVIGLVGSTGDSTGPHLHFELRDAAGNAQDPRGVLQA